jgi:hypothetical protein
LERNFNAMGEWSVLGEIHHSWMLFLILRVIQPFGRRSVVDAIQHLCMLACDFISVYRRKIDWG